MSLMVTAGEADGSVVRGSSVGVMVEEK